MCEQLFSSNKDQSARAVEEVASGGEKSRLMLAMKSVLAGFSHWAGGAEEGATIPQRARKRLEQ